MPIHKINIEEFLALSKNNLLIDVRSPSEYTHAHIPNSVNIPLFNDEERKIVGTTYKQQSRENAIKIGLDFFGPKMRKVVEEVELAVGKQQLAKGKGQQAVSKEQLVPKAFGSNEQTAVGKGQEAVGSLQFAESNIQNEPGYQLLPIDIGTNCVLIHCWRGGMRSQAVAWLLDLYGFNVYLLQGGYKAYRNWVLQQFEKEYNFKILGGYTGSGKTYLLEALQKNGKTIIDLEGIANHKGSALGAIGMGKQPTQEMFENILAEKLFEKNIESSKHNKPFANCQLPTEKDLPLTENSIWMEDESQRIGNLILPNALWFSMRSSKVYFIEIPFEERLDFLTKEYGTLKKEELVSAGIRIQKRLGGLETKNYINFLLENNFKEAFRILLAYYDKHYTKGLYNRKNAKEQIKFIPATNVNAANNLHLLNEIL
jgi:tRNA 2-selenouridine synthase